MKKYIFILSTLFLSCKDNEIDLLPSEQEKKDQVANELKGKFKAYVVTTDKEEIRTELGYDVSTKTINKITITYKSDGKKVEQTLSKTNVQINKIITDTKIGDKTEHIEREFEYDSKGLVSKVTEVNTTTNELFSETYQYDADGKLQSMIRYKTNGTSALPQTSAKYVWQESNVKTFKDNTRKGEFEEEDYQYSDTENILSKLYTEELKIPTLQPEQMSKFFPKAMVRLFEGSMFRYENKFNNEGKISKRITTQFINSQWVTASEMSFEYY